MKNVKGSRAMTRPSVDYTDDEDINSFQELPQAASKAEEIKKVKKKGKK